MPVSRSCLRSVTSICVLGWLGLACQATEPGKTAPSGAEPGKTEPCASDADCTLACGSGCCRSSCPCTTAVTTAEARRREQKMRDECSDRKMMCPLEGRDACDWDARVRATCSSGTCVAEPIDGGAAPEHRAPSTPERYAVTDAECRLCRAWDDRPAGANTCSHLVEWPCSSERSCHMTVPCDPACCASQADR